MTIEPPYNTPSDPCRFAAKYVLLKLRPPLAQLVTISLSCIYNAMQWRMTLLSTKDDRTATLTGTIKGHTYWTTRLPTSPKPHGLLHAILRPTWPRRCMKSLGTGHQLLHTHMVRCARCYSPHGHADFLSPAVPLKRLGQLEPCLADPTWSSRSVNLHAGSDGILASMKAVLLPCSCAHPQYCGTRMQPARLPGCERVAAQKKAACKKVVQTPLGSLSRARDLPDCPSFPRKRRAWACCTSTNPRTET